MTTSPRRRTRQPSSAYSRGDSDGGLAAGLDDEVVAHDDRHVVRRGPARAAGATGERADARDELGERERLDEVVVGARVERGDARLDGIARGEHEHRHVDARAAQLLEHVEAVAIRQAEIEDHQIEVAAQAARDRLGARCR